MCIRDSQNITVQETNAFSFVQKKSRALRKTGRTLRRPVAGGSSAHCALVRLSLERAGRPAFRLGGWRVYPECTCARPGSMATPESPEWPRANRGGPRKPAQSVRKAGHPDLGVSKVFRRLLVLGREKALIIPSSNPSTCPVVYVKSP